jgi:hypothetical protein
MDLVMRGELQRERPAGSQISVSAERPSIFGGGIVCGSITTAQTAVGQCIWQSSVVSIQVNTFSANLPAVADLTVRVVTELHNVTPGS